MKRWKKYSQNLLIICPGCQKIRKTKLKTTLVSWSAKIQPKLNKIWKIFRKQVFWQFLFNFDGFHSFFNFGWILKVRYTQYPIIRNGDQRWLVEFLKKYWFIDSDRFLFSQASLVTVSYSYLSNKRTCPLILFKKKVQPTLWFSCNRLKIPPYLLVLRVGWIFYPTHLL